MFTPQTTQSLPNLVLRIKETFYNTLVDLTTDLDDIMVQNIDDKMKAKIQMTVYDIIKFSLPRSPNETTQDCINLPSGDRITAFNCPPLYQPFFSALMGIKRAFLTFNAEHLNHIRDNLLHNNMETDIEKNIKAIADKILLMDEFKKMLPEVKKFLLEAKGLSVVEKPRRVLDEMGVTKDLIRDTFYNEMVNQVVRAKDENLIAVTDLEDQESYIFFALPGLTLIEAVNQAKGLNGIPLLNNKMLTATNCPRDENFPNLFLPIFAKKEAIQALTANEMKVVKIMSLAKDMELPDELKPHKTAAAVQCVTVINEIASEISRRRYFKETVNNVIVFCKESLCPPAPQVHIQPRRM